MNLELHNKLAEARRVEEMYWDYQVAISGCEITFARSADDIRNYHFNKAMGALFKSGCKRIRAAVPRRPRTGDMEIYTLRGWKE